MSRFQPNFAILPEAQKAFWPSLAGTRSFGMVLYGGTAIALRLGHRASVDFDFFSKDELPSRDQLSQAFPFLVQSKILQAQKNTLSVLATPLGDPEKTVNVSLFGGIDFGRVGTPQLTKDGLVEVASLDDLMSTKLKVMMQRVLTKDYRDIAALLRAGVDLPRGLAAAEQMYGPAFQPSESLKALTYFQGGDLAELSQEDRETLVEAVQRVRELPEVTLVSRELSKGDREREISREL
jgi:predicted nucleotidyltransferase component of viral defense system